MSVFDSNSYVRFGTHTITLNTEFDITRALLPVFFKRSKSLRPNHVFYTSKYDSFIPTDNSQIIWSKEKIEITNCFYLSCYVLNSFIGKGSSFLPGPLCVKANDWEVGNFLYMTNKTQEFSIPTRCFMNLKNSIYCQLEIIQSFHAKDSKFPENSYLLEKGCIVSEKDHNAYSNQYIENKYMVTSDIVVLKFKKDIIAKKKTVNQKELGSSVFVSIYNIDSNEKFGDMSFVEHVSKPATKEFVEVIGRP